MGIIHELTEQLYSGERPYDSAQRKWIDDGFMRTNLMPELVESVLTETGATFWLELGSMIGGSAIVTANVVKRLGTDTGIVCMDPFCGDVNMWSWEHNDRAKGNWRLLRLQDCRPTIFDRFLANVTEAGHQDIILPVTVTSLVGMKLLSRLLDEKRIARAPDVIYLDSAHEPDETFLELASAWRLLPRGGVLLGDDWRWEAVRNDVLKFARDITQNASLVGRLRDRHPQAVMESNVLLFNHLDAAGRETAQWALTKPV